MAKDVFSVPIFFIVFRETLEASIIIAVLLGLVEQIVHSNDGTSSVSTSRPSTPGGPTDFTPATEKSEGDVAPVPTLEGATDTELKNKRIIRSMRLQILAGAGLGLFLALAIGAAFIAVWFTQASNLWAKSEELWEGIFSVVASLMILVMALGVLRLDRARAKWRVKIRRAFEKGSARKDRGAMASRWALFLLPFITVLREGMEAVVFVGGVSLGQKATAIPLAAIIGIICGLVVGYLIYAFASRTALRVFMIVMTNFLFLIGAGLFSKAVSYFLIYRFDKLLGSDIDDAANAGNGPGSYDVRGVVWHLDCCNPESKFGHQGWVIFGAIFGWTNNATVGSILSYIFYWLLVIGILVFMRIRERRAVRPTAGEKQ